MELKPIFRRVIGLDIHQAKISACALSEQSDGSVTIESVPPVSLHEIV